MAGGRGNRKEAAENAPRGASPSDAGTSTQGIPDLLRRAFSLGFSGFFLTEGAVRKALGDTVPKDWADFVVEQSERTRAEFLERLTHEIAGSLDRIDLARIAQEVLDGRTVEVTARIRLVESEADAPDVEVRADVDRGKAGGPKARRTRKR